MTKEELDRHLEQRQRLERAYDMLQSMRDTITQAHKLDGMPRGTDISDKVGNIAVAIADLEARIQNLEDEVYATEDEIRDFAESFEDERLQMAIVNRYINGFTWGQTAELLGESFSADWVKQLFYRAMKERAEGQGIA